MLWALALAICLASGWFVTRALTADLFIGPRWASVLAEVSIGALLAPGLASILCFALVATGGGTQGGVLGVLAALLVISVAIWWKLTPNAHPRPAPPKRFPWTWALGICAAAALIFLLLDFQAAVSANPHGEWDAMSIWSLRGRLLSSGGDLWGRAVSSEIGGHMTGAAHPGYPLFLSGFLALLWIADGTAIGTWDQAVPITVSLLVSVSALALLVSSLAARKSVSLGVLAGLVLLASEVFASQVSAQYSDLLQGLAFLTTLVLLEAADDSGSPRAIVAVGLAAGLSAWIKNEGLSFSIAALGVAAWRFRSPGLQGLAIGAIPGLAAVAVLKLFIAQGSDSVLPHSVGATAARVAEAGRWWQAALGFGKAIYDAGGGLTHPVLLCAVLAFALRFVPPAESRAKLWLWIPVAVTAAAEYSLYLITEANLDWHISTSISRLVAQLWPSLIWLFFLQLRAPEELVEVAPTPVPVHARRTAKRSRS
jgi:hypothetical protein